MISDDDKSEDRGSDCLMLAQRGVPVAFDDEPSHMHHKFAIADRSRLLTGSYNWTRSAAKYNEENYIITNDENLLTEFSRAFNALWDRLR